MCKIISEQAAEAFRKGYEFKKSNTEVIVFREAVVLSLWGNWIAARRKHGKKVFANHCGWETATTKERLSAVGVDVRIKGGKFVTPDGKPFKNDNLWKLI